VIFTGFPWIASATAPYGWPMQGYAPLGGVYLLSFLTLALAALAWLLSGAAGAIVAWRRSSWWRGEALRHVEWTRRRRRRSTRAPAGQRAAGDEIPARALREDPRDLRAGSPTSRRRS
jgi:apolipoprotein N-acyltransferase